MKLITALRYTQPASVAFVGAGGKTSAIFRCARELISSEVGDTEQKTVLVTTSTHLGSWQSKFADRHIFINSPSNIAQFEDDIPDGIVLLTGDESDSRLGGLSSELLGVLHMLAVTHKLPLLIEADGAHLSPLKAPALHEPVIPEFCGLVVVVAGMSGLGHPLEEPWVQRPGLFARITGEEPGEQITPEMIVKAMLSEAGGLKNIPSGARTVALLNQADTAEIRATAKVISERLVTQYHSVIISSLAHGAESQPSGSALQSLADEAVYSAVEPIGGIILAAGGSSRFGKPKQVLGWRGESLIRHVAKTALDAGLHPVVVVVGSSAEEVISSLKDQELRIVNNSNWINGLSTSIRVGLQSLPVSVGGVVFLQVDQPQIPVQLIRRLVEAHQATVSKVVAPRVNGQRGNPVLFDACTFPDLIALTGDMGGRALFEKYPIEWVDWDDANILLDIDTPEDYRKLLEFYPDA
jgi:molybdenum cofactor cytidylyltransferase